MVQVFASVGAREAEEDLGVSRAVGLPSFAPLSRSQNCTRMLRPLSDT